jgi:ribose transport system ATP-binding protein
MHNIGITLFGATVRHGLVSTNKERKAVEEIVARFDVKAASLSQRILNLSGGNQQKAIIGRALAIHPKVLILDEPTRGIDVRTKVEVYRIIRDLAERGIGVIVVSSEMIELRRCATRIICLHSGRMQGEFDSRTCSNEELVTAIFGKTRENS